MIRQPSPRNPSQKKSRVWIKRAETAELLYILCRSEGRKAKDEAIRLKQEKRLLADLERLSQRVEAGRLPTEKVYEAFGRLKERYPRVARYWKMEYEEEPRKLSWIEDRDKKQRALRLDGAYLLKTDRKDLSDDEAWRLYMLLTRVEDAFRDMKSPLSERPIFHHLQHRVEAHIFLCVLAYHLLVTIEKYFLDQGIHTSWATLRQATDHPSDRHHRPTGHRRQSPQDPSGHHAGSPAQRHLPYSRHPPPDHRPHQNLAARRAGSTRRIVTKKMAALVFSAVYRTNRRSRARRDLPR